MLKFSKTLIFALSLSLVSAVSVMAQDDPPPSPWSFEAELSAVNAGGNQESRTFGTDAKATYKKAKSELVLRAGGLYQESALKTRTANGDSASFVVQETKVTEKTAESYYARARYDYNVSPRFLVFGGIDWMRNTFAGIDSRTLIAAGAGNTWQDNDKVKFKTYYSATYTFQTDVVENPFVKSDFPGARFGFDFWSQLSETVEFQSKFVGDLNLDNTDDVRFEWDNALPIRVSSILAFKPALLLMWRNQPSLTTVSLVPGPGNVAVPLEKLDTFASVALLVKL